MAKFSKFLFGGIIGAGVALLFAPKPGRELRRMLLGSGRPALPRPEAPAAGPVSTAPGGGVNFESRLEETRRQVETQLAEARPDAGVEATAEGSPVGAAEGEEAVAALELKIETAEAELELGAEAAALVEEDFVVEETAAGPPVAAGAGEEAEAPEEPAAEPPEAVAPPLATTPEPEQAEPAEPVRFPAEELESEMAEEELAVAGLEAEAQAEDRERATESGETMDSPAATPERPNLAEMAQMEPEPEADADMFSALKTPAEGEPTVEEENEPEPEAAAPAVPAPPVAPQPGRSRLDQDEMRRRIDETRARLKAKAFDAMVSGETFMETEADRDRKRERLSSPELEGDVETQIDKVIKEDS